MSIVLPAPQFRAPPLLLARRAVRHVRTSLRQYRHAAKIELLSQFESLGDNCEFASLQRENGVNLPAMFKWSETSIRMLVETLDNDLAGAADLANLRIDTGAHDGEYQLHHRLYRSNSHTFARIDVEPAERVLQREHRRLIMLKRKFLEDVREGRRIYVFRSLRPVDESEVMALHQALRRKGPNTLLWVRPAARPQDAGRVERGPDGLLMAQIDVLAPYESGMACTSRHWLPILRAARALRPRPDHASTTDLAA